PTRCGRAATRCPSARSRPRTRAPARRPRRTRGATARSPGPPASRRGRAGAVAGRGVLGHEPETRGGFTPYAFEVGLDGREPLGPQVVDAAGALGLLGHH